MPIRKDKEFDIHGHILWSRDGLSKLLPDFSNAVNTNIPENFSDNKLWKDIESIEGDGWRYIKHRGFLGIRLPKPMLYKDVNKILFDGILENNKSSVYIEKYLKEIDEYKERKRKNVLRNASLLTRTTKMGCYSWDLPAGPPVFGGCCPASSIGFNSECVNMKPISMEDKGASILQVINKLKNNIDLDYINTLPKDKKEAVVRFVCNSCYALKGSYGSPTMILIMEIRKKWLKEFALPSGNFQSHMISAIRYGQQKSIREYKGVSKKPEEIPNPNFFRIHDSGDFFSEEYFAAWLDIVNHMKDVHFWAPTRIWSHPKGAEWLDRQLSKGIPKNLCIRPSSVFFNTTVPIIRGLNSGASSNTISYEAKKGSISIKAKNIGDSFVCPAYVPSVIGGGARKKVKKNPVVNQVYPMYPSNIDITKEPKKYIFYDSIYNKKTKSFILDNHGRPIMFTKQLLSELNSKNSDHVILKAQRYEVAGCCTVAIDPKGMKECRVCWGVSDNENCDKFKRLTVVYSKH